MNQELKKDLDFNRRVIKLLIRIEQNEKNPQVKYYLNLLSEDMLEIMLSALPSDSINDLNSNIYAAIKNEQKNRALDKAFKKTLK